MVPPRLTSHSSHRWMRLQEKLGLDLIELRLRNALQVGDRGPSGPRSRAASCRRASNAGHKFRLAGARRQPRVVGSLRRGVGVGCQLHSATSFPGR